MARRRCNRGGCKKEENPEFACSKCNIPFCSTKCQADDSWHAYFCAKAEAKKEKLLKEEATTQQPKTKGKPTKGKQVKKVAANKEPMHIKAHGLHQDHEAQIYSLFAKRIDIYRNFCKVLPGTEGLQFPVCDRLDPQSRDVESTYVELVGLLEQIHAAGVVCSDLRPEHVWTRNGKLIILDFDRAHLVSGGSTGGITLATWRSVDQLANQPCDIVDDLEAACKIAKHWASRKDEEKFQQQTQALHVGVSQLASLLNGSANDWLDDHLRYVVSLPRGAPNCAATYAKLSRGCSFKFTVGDFHADFAQRSREMQLKEVHDADSTTKFKSALKDQLADQLANLFVADSRIDIDLFYPNQPFFGTCGKQMAEWDFVVRKHQSFLPLPNNSLRDCYPRVDGGECLVVKTLPDLCMKLDVLFAAHRPIHTLYYIAWLCLVCEGPLTSDGQEIRMAGPALLAVSLDKLAVDLSVLIAAGRFSLFPLRVRPSAISEYVDEIKKLKEENERLRAKVQQLENQVQQLLSLLGVQPTSSVVAVQQTSGG